MIATQETKRLDNAKLHDSFAITQLAGKRHDFYHGCVWKDGSGLFVLYDNLPVNVMYSHTADGSAIYVEKH